MIFVHPNLFVEIVPLESASAPKPHPVTDAHFDLSMIYKVLGAFSPSETSEAYFILSNPDRQIWFISNRHLRAFGIFESDSLSLPKVASTVMPLPRALVTNALPH